jgi:hypothetical protein
MKSYVDLIEQILNKGGKIVDWEKLESSFTMNEYASFEDITKCDSYCGQKLPEEYKYFWKHYDGGILFKYDDIGGFEFLSTSDFIKENELHKECFGEDWDNSVILFCNLLGTGEYLGFRLHDDSKYNIVHCVMIEHPDEWQSIEDSFDTLIETIIKEKGKEYWLFQ